MAARNSIRSISNTTPVTFCPFSPDPFNARGVLDGASGGFLPNGTGAVLTGAFAATGFYFGAELVTIAAAEFAEPEQAVAKAVQSVISRVLVFYSGSIFPVVTILAWNGAGIVRPYVSALAVTSRVERGHRLRRAGRPDPRGSCARPAANGRPPRAKPRR